MYPWKCSHIALQLCCHFWFIEWAVPWLSVLYKFLCSWLGCIHWSVGLNLRCGWICSDVWPASPGALNHHLRGPSASSITAIGMEQAGPQLPSHYGHGLHGGEWPRSEHLCKRAVNLMQTACFARWLSLMCVCHALQWHDWTITGHAWMALHGRPTPVVIWQQLVSMHPCRKSLWL